MLSAQPILQQFLCLIARHKGAIANTLQSGGIFTRVVVPDEKGV